MNNETIPVKKEILINRILCSNNSRSRERFRIWMKKRLNPEYPIILKRSLIVAILLNYI